MLKFQGAKQDYLVEFRHRRLHAGRAATALTQCAIFGFDPHGKPFAALGTSISAPKCWVRWLARKRAFQDALKCPLLDADCAALYDGFRGRFQTEAISRPLTKRTPEERAALAEQGRAAYRQAVANGTRQPKPRQRAASGGIQYPHLAPGD